MLETELPLHYAVALLTLNDRKGRFCMYANLAIGGALVSELILCGFIEVEDDKLRTVRVVTDEAADDPWLDELLSMMRTDAQPRGLCHWVTKAGTIQQLGKSIAKHLCDMKVLREENFKVMRLFNASRFLVSENRIKDTIRDRMSKVMFDDSKNPDASTAFLISIARTTGTLKSNFDRDQLRRHRPRVIELASEDVFAAQATKKVIVTNRTVFLLTTLLPAFGGFLR